VVDACRYTFLGFAGGDDFNALPIAIKNEIVEGLQSLSMCEDLIYTYNLNKAGWWTRTAHTMFGVEGFVYHGEFSKTDDHFSDSFIRQFDSFVDLMVQ